MAGAPAGPFAPILRESKHLKVRSLPRTRECKFYTAGRGQVEVSSLTGHYDRSCAQFSPNFTDCFRKVTAEPGLLRFSISFLLAGKNYNSLRRRNKRRNRVWKRP